MNIPHKLLSSTITNLFPKEIGSIIYDYYDVDTHNKIRLIKRLTPTYKDIATIIAERLSSLMVGPNKINNGPLKLSHNGVSFFQKDKYINSITPLIEKVVTDLKGTAFKEDEQLCISEEQYRKDQMNIIKAFPGFGNIGDLVIDTLFTLSPSDKHLIFNVLQYPSLITQYIYEIWFPNIEIAPKLNINKDMLVVNYSYSRFDTRC